ncbi:MAG: 7-carboxy-7-deazaguanine synthase QueE [Polyangiaceae bacterium]
MSDTRTGRRLALLEGKPDGVLLVHEIYRSLQGESTFAGLPFAFVRLAVCDARCTWCDTPHAFYEGKRMSVDEVVDAVVDLDVPRVLVTGGEPMLQDEVHPLMARLCDRGCVVLLETSGAHDVRRVDPRVHVIMDIKCPDSGESENHRWENLDVLWPNAQIKFVVASREDFTWAAARCLEHHLTERFEVLFSAAFELVAPRDLAGWLLDSGLRARMQLQQHKYIWEPDTRGV